MSTALELNSRTLPWMGVHPVERVRRITPLLRGESVAIEKGRRLTPAALDAVHSQGLYRALLPKQ